VLAQDQDPSPESEEGLPGLRWSKLSFHLPDNTKVPIFSKMKRGYAVILDVMGSRQILDGNLGVVPSFWETARGQRRPGPNKITNWGIPNWIWSNQCPLRRANK
jgi:hypothetical protein